MLSGLTQKVHTVIALTFVASFGLGAASIILHFAEKTDYAIASMYRVELDDTGEFATVPQKKP